MLAMSLAAFGLSGCDFDHGMKLICVRTLGLPRLCADSVCNGTMVTIKWSDVLRYIQSKGLWTNFNFKRTGYIEFELQTFDLNSRVRATVGGWANHR